MRGLVAPYALDLRGGEVLRAEEAEHRHREVCVGEDDARANLARRLSGARLEAQARDARPRADDDFLHTVPEMDAPACRLDRLCESIGDRLAAPLGVVRAP